MLDLNFVAMKTLPILLLALVMTSTPISQAAQPRADLWLKVEEAIKKGLPQTAITHLEPIIAGALKDQAYGEAAKAIARKIVLEGNIQGNKPEEKIARMEAELARAPREIVPLLNTIQATWYWHYFQQNRWRFIQRTATAEPPEDPPGTHSGFQGFLLGPKQEFSVEEPKANSSMLVFRPKMVAPDVLSFLITVAS